MPIGTLTQKTLRHEISESTPPSTRPRKLPAIAAIWLMPSAMPRRCAGKASVRIAVELAKSIEPPTACTRRQPMIHSAAPPPEPGVSANAIEDAVKTAKPRLYIRTRPTRSPSRPRLTTSTALTSR
jgi:hypothetical protein